MGKKKKSISIMRSAHQSKEFADTIEWRRKSQKLTLIPSNCLAVWTDICGFGDLLKNSNWNLTRAQSDGIVKLLSELHSTAGRPMLSLPDPGPNEKTIILNDGVAKTVDLTYIDKLHPYIFLFFLRDLIIAHFNLLEITNSYNAGIRTILAGGERIQYSPNAITGHSILNYNENKISPFGQRMLSTTFVYNPAEFQMNTAFAKAFTIDGIGSIGGILVNGFYIESDFLNKIKPIKGIEIKMDNNEIDIYHQGILVFKLHVAETIPINIKGFNLIVYHIDKYFIYKAFDGDDVEFDLYRKRKMSRITFLLRCLFRAKMKFASS